MADDQTPDEKLVPTVRTVIAPADLYQALKKAWETLLDPQTATRDRLLVLMAQWALETGNGAAANNFNLAGIKHLPGDGHNYAAYRTREFLGGAWEVLVCNFRAYDSLDAAALDYLQLLRGRFAAAWPAVEAGDVGQFARRLKLGHYYTAPEAEYAAGLAARRAWLDARVPQDAGPADDVAAPNAVG